MARSLRRFWRTSRPRRRLAAGPHPLAAAARRAVRGKKVAGVRQDMPVHAAATPEALMMAAAHAGAPSA
jgi:hypothetical protein